MSRFSGSGLRYTFIQEPLYETKDDFRWQNRLILDFGWNGDETNISLDVLGPWMTQDDEIEAGEEESQMCLARIKLAGFMKVLEIPMVCQYQERTMGPLTAMPQLFQN